MELSGIGEMGDAAMKFDFPACMGAGELLKEAAPEQAGEDLDRGQEGAASGLPLAGCDIEAGVRHDDMQMRMEAELLVPSVEDRGAADTQSTVTVVLGDGAQGLGGGAKQDVEHDLAVAKGDPADFFGQRKYKRGSTGTGRISAARASSHCLAASPWQDGQWRLRHEL